MMIEKFNVEIFREKGDFIAEIDFKDGEKRFTQGKQIQELYQRISEVLCLRLEEEGEVMQLIRNICKLPKTNQRRKNDKPRN